MATKRFQIYKCPVCDTAVEVIDELGLELVCCGPPMMCLEEQLAGRPDADKHIPVLERDGDTLRVCVGGDGMHPMDEDHHIGWIELLADGIAYRRFLGVGDLPQAEFPIWADSVVARVYCSRHGLWKAGGEPRRAESSTAEMPARA